MSVIVPAAGCGARAAQNGNKILAPLAGHPLLYHTLRHLLTASQSKEYSRNPGSPEVSCSIVEVIIAARRDEWPLIQSVWNEVQTDTAISPTFQLVEGGATRQDSVLAAARAASSDFVAVHDAARPFASRELLENVWRGALSSGAAIAALPASDTVKRAGNAGISKSPAEAVGCYVAQTLERGEVWLAQTPQVFRRELLLEALETAARDGWAGTDCASAVERLLDDHGNARVAVALVEGDAGNFKVTFAPDLARAEWALQQMAEK